MVEKLQGRATSSARHKQLAEEEQAVMSGGRSFIKIQSL
jgi:hypothetical protein